MIIRTTDMLTIYSGAVTINMKNRILNWDNMNIFKL